MRPAWKMIVLALAASVWLGCSSYHDRVWRCPDGQCGFLSGRFDGCSSCTHCPTCRQVLGHCTCHPLQRLRSRLTCGEGCGESYYNEWANDPPDECDPCDPVSGRYVGRRNCTQGCSNVVPYRLYDVLLGRRCSNHTCGSWCDNNWCGNGTMAGSFVGGPVDESSLGWGDRALMQGNPPEDSQPAVLPPGAMPGGPRATMPPSSLPRSGYPRSKSPRSQSPQAPRNTLPADESPRLEEAGAEPEARLLRPTARTMSAKKTVRSDLRR